MQEQIDLTYIEQMRMDIRYKEAKLAIILQEEDGAARLRRKQEQKLDFQIELLAYQLVKCQTEVGPIEVVRE